MRAIIIGAGQVGRNIAATLSREGHDVTILERDAGIAAEVESQIDALVMNDLGSSPQALREAGAGEADLLAAVTGVDEVNMLAAVFAHQIGTKRTVARVANPDYLEADVVFAHRAFGVDFMVDAQRATARELAVALSLPAAVNVEYFAAGRLAVAESVLTEESPLVGVGLDAANVEGPFVVVGSSHNGHPELVGPDTRLTPGDHVLVAAPRDEIAGCLRRLAGGARPVRDVTLFGSGTIGRHLAGFLHERGRSVTMLEGDPARARELAEKLPGCAVICDEGIAKEALLVHGVDQGAFVACADDDRANLLAALHARQIGASPCLAVVSREEFVPLVGALGIDSAFSPRLIAAQAILRLARGAAVRALHVFVTGFEVLEVEPAEGAPIAGTPADRVRLPPGCRVGAIVRDERVIVPADRESIEAGDRVIVFGLEGSTSRAEESFN